MLHFFRRRQEAHWADLRAAYPYDDRKLRARLAALLKELERDGQIHVVGQGARVRWRLGPSK